MNFLPCRIGEGGRVLHLVGGVDLPVPPARVPECARHVGRALTFGLRPEHICVGATGETGLVRAPGRVLLVEPLGSDTLGLVTIGMAADAGEMTGRFPPEAGLAVGQNLEVGLALNRFHLFDPETGLAIRGADW
jgi:multiple sugar transport system ATP-binding protein